MRGYSILIVLILFVLNSCAQSNEFIGRIYILESQENFFQLKDNGVAKYYSIQNMGEKKLIITDAIWDMSKDTVLTLIVNYEPDFENAKFVLTYNKEKDYWIDEDFISAFRRIKKVKYEEFELNEF